jgi:hypothetical protein
MEMSDASRKDVAVPSKMVDNPKKVQRNERSLLATPNTSEEPLGNWTRKGVGFGDAAVH